MLPGVGSDFGRYRITGRLGRGGMGVVFSAVHRDLDRPVALKLLTPDLSDDDSYRHRFLREARILARLDSPHIVRVYDTGEQDGWLFIATQLIEGGDLKQVLDTTGPLPLAAGVELVAQVCEGLAEAHEAGILHRDIKPSNVLLRPRSDGRRQAILCDLGIATVAGSDSTLTVGVIGTPTYMSPERHQGEDATVASDIYALGCLLWATITGGPPYQGTSAEIFRGHVHGPVPQLQAGVPHSAQLNEVLAGTLAKDPAQRYLSAADVLVALRAVDPFLFQGSYRDDTTDTQRGVVPEGTIVVPYVESVGVGPVPPADAPSADFLAADAVPAAEPSVEAPPVPTYEPSFEMLPPPAADTSVDLPPPAALEASVELPPPPPVAEAASPAILPPAPPPSAPPPPAPPAVETVAVPEADPNTTSQRPPGAPVPPPPPSAFVPSSSPPPSSRRRRSAVLVGIVALALAAVAAVVLVAVAPWSGSDKDATDPTAADGSTTPTEPPSSEPTVAPPPAPKAPKVTSDAAYLKVTFTVAPVKAPGDDKVAYERRKGEKWVPVDRTFSLPTREGGDQACADVRATLTGDGGSTPGAATHRCGASKPKDVRILMSDTTSCSAADQAAGAAVGKPCYAFVVELAGFRAGAKAPMSIVSQCSGSCHKTITVGPDGRGRLDGAAYEFATHTLTIEVGGITRSYEIPG